MNPSPQPSPLPEPAPDDVHFARSFSTDERGVDEIDRMSIVDPHECHAPNRRSDGELAGILGLLDELQAGREDT